MKVKPPLAFKFRVPWVGAVTTAAVSASPLASLSLASTPEPAVTVSPIFLLVA